MSWCGASWLARNFSINCVSNCFAIFNFEIFQVNPFASGSTSVSAPLFDFSTSSSNEFLLRSIAATKQNAAMPPLPPTVIQPLPASYAALLQTNLLNSISASLRDLNALIQSSSASSIAGSTPLFAPYFVLPQTSMAQPTQEVPTMATSTQCLGEHNRSIGGSGGVMHSVLSILGGDVTMPQQQSGNWSLIFWTKLLVS